MHGGLISLFCCAALLCAAQQPQASDEQVAARFQEARDAFHAGRLDAAAAAYKDVLRWRPGLLEARMNLGLVHFSAGAYQSAVTEMTSVIQAQPSLAPAHVILGLSWMKLASPGKAAAALRRGVRLNPSDAEARRALALCDQATGNYGEAVEQFRALFALEPDPETAWFQLGHSYLELSRQLTDELLSRYPSSVWLQRLKGDLLCDRSLWTAAEQEYRTALALDPAQPGLRAALIAAQKHADPAVESIPRGCTTGDDQACAASLRASRPPTADGYLRLGRTWLRLRNDEKASDALSAALRERGDAETMYWLVRAYARLSERCFGRLLSAFPKSARTHQLRAETNRVRGANDEATREYRAAIRLRPDDAGLHAALGELYLLVHSPAEARVELETAARLDPDARTLHLLGRAYLGQDEFAQAVPYLERAVHSGPELLEAHADLGRAYLRTGKPDLAAPELEKALPLDRSGDLHYLLFQCYSALGKSESASAALARSRALRKAAFAGDRARFPGAITPP
ncbi:MAG TPA: tetratricopeptide repeat protein [Bryobacteraceae bacterium]|nr:tetratricopeptide repeat protein [Bryobacteraceae bacterium]